LSKVLTDQQRDQLRKLAASRTLADPPPEDKKPANENKGKKPGDK
jgi:hypothetical protein